MKTSNMAHWKTKKRMSESNRRPILTDEDFDAILFCGRKRKSRNWTHKTEGERNEQRF